MKVLLVVDVQNDFCPGGALAVQEGDKVVPVINQLMCDGGYDLIIASQDWHPANHGSFASNHAGRSVFEKVQLDGLEQILWPAHCVQGTKGAEFRSDLESERFIAVVRKGLDPQVDSYSAFMDNGKRNRTELLTHLINASQAAHVPISDFEIDVVGLALDYCVKATAIDAAAVCSNVKVLLEATRAVDSRPEAVAQVIRDLKDQNVDVISVAQRLNKEVRDVDRIVDRTMQP